VVILDDGFQDLTIKKNLNIVCFNSNQLDGNGWVLPAGPLRENFNSIKRANIIIINGEKNNEFEQKILNISRDLKIYYSKYLPANIDQFLNKKIHAFAGIGNPSNFFKILSEHDLTIDKKIIFPDHYNYTQKDLKNIMSEAIKNKSEIITTEKDFFRIKDYGFKKIKCLELNLKILEEEKFIEDVLNYL
jgi:tetraacyldisaccharide 4'-kinase